MPVLLMVLGLAVLWLVVRCDQSHATTSRPNLPITKEVPHPKVVLILLILLSLWLSRKQARPAPPPAPSLEQIQRLATLVTLRITVDDRVEVSASGYLGELDVVWRGPGVVLIGPDLRKARLVSKDDVRRVLTIELPEPAVLSTQVDLERGRVSAP